MDALSTTSMRRPLGAFLNWALGKKSGDAKRETAWADYGYPEELCFSHFYNAFKRNGLGKAGITRHVDKTWETPPWVIEGSEGDNPHEETAWEKQIATLVKNLHLWQRFQAADWRNRIGRYSALYLVFGDGNTPDKPVEKSELLRVQPLYEAQLQVSECITDRSSPQYGQPAMYKLFQQSSDSSYTEIQVHPDRIHILAEGADDDSINGIPALEAGYNDLLTLEKIAGAGGEGFWKAARGAFSVEGNFNAEELAAAFGVPVEKLGDRLDEAVADFSSGMDKALMLGGSTAKQLTFTVPNPEQFFLNALYGFSASLSCPIPILIGQQISQRSSEENSKEWAQTITSRRRNFVTPNIEKFIRHLMRLGAIEERDFYIDWDDLDAPGKEQKLDNASKMSAINKDSMGTGEQPPFSYEEIREAAGYEHNREDDNDGFDDTPPADTAEE